MVAFDTCQRRPSTTLLELFAERAAPRVPERPALIGGAATISYETLRARVQGIAAGLAESGFGAGDVLALWAPNVPQWLGVALGAMAAGGAVTGVSPLAADRELSGQLIDSGASVLVTVPELEERARAAAPDAVRVTTPPALLRRRRARPLRRARTTSRCCPTRAARPACRRA